MNNPQPIGAFAIITNAKDQVLLGKRKNSYKAGMFGFPGGRVELHETTLTTITREVIEEVGLKNLQFTFLGVIRENQGEYDFIHFVFSTQTDQEPMLCEPDKCEGWEWVDVNKEIDNLLPGHRAGLELYKTNQLLIDLV